MQPNFELYRFSTMPKSMHVPAEPCPVARSLNVIGDRWSLLIVRDAFDGICRFSDFQRNLGVARNILAERLRRLVEADILVAQAPEDGGAYQQYVLTDRGRNLFPVMLAFRQWGEQQLFSPVELHSELVEKATGARVQPMAPRRADGSPLLPGDTMVRKLF